VLKYRRRSFITTYPGHGEGFWANSDCRRWPIRPNCENDGLLESACRWINDVHHGNGTAAIFAGWTRQFTLSIHQYPKYPQVQAPSDVDIIRETA